MYLALLDMMNIKYKVEYMMEKMNVSYLKIDLSHNIVSFNTEFESLFNLKNNPPANLLDIAADLPTNIMDFLNEVSTNEMKSMIIIKNNSNLIGNECSVLFLYAAVVKTIDSYIIRMVNWLNWIHQLHDSFSQSYSFVSGLNNVMSKDNFMQISDASCFKAMYPLITHVPSKFFYGVNQGVLFDIMHLFIRQRNGEKFTKDYSRNIYSRLRTNLRKDFNLENVELADVISDDQLLSIKDGNDIQIPRTAVIESIASFIDNDNFLLQCMNAVQPI